MARRLFFLSSFAFVATIIFVTGCGHKQHPVSGVVTLDGKPFANGTITFVPESGPAAYGSTDDQGRFTLESLNKQGARAGTYKIALNKFDTQKANPDDEGRNITEANQLKSQLPEKLTKAETSGLSITVPSADGKYNVVATSK